MIRSFKWHLQFPLNFPFSLLAESWFCVMATLNFWLTFFPTIVCPSGRQLSQFTEVSRDYSSITAVDSRWACSHLFTKPALLTNTNKKTNISLPSQLCWKTQTNKDKHKHLSTKPALLTKWLRREESCMLQMWPQPFPGVRALRHDLCQYKHKHTSTIAHKHTST